MLYINYTEQVARHVTELYLDQWNSTTGSTFEKFVRTADRAGIDVLLYVGEDAGPARAEAVATVVEWCGTSNLCGPTRVNVKPSGL